MRVFLFIISVFWFLCGVGVFLGAKSAVHEIEGCILILISVVCMSGAGIIEAVNRLRVDVLAQQSSRS